ncbi:MAG: hypothetical protein ACKVX7_09305 [Planctomycetota bacterium]
MRSLQMMFPLLLLSATLHAQLFVPADLQLVAGSELLSGCAQPSPCDCLVIQVGNVTGTFHLTPLLPPLLPIVDFAVENIDWTVSSPSGGIDPVPSAITGAGFYLFNITDNTHSMDLELEFDGVPRSFTSGGFVPAGGPLLGNGVVIYVYDMIDTCMYDGIAIHASVIDPPQRFRRADCNLDGAYDIADAIDMLTRLFSPLTVLPLCRDACDANDDGAFDIADPIFALSNLFGAGANPPAPFPGCGIDPTADTLGCSEYPLCPDTVGSP